MQEAWYYKQLWTYENEIKRLRETNENIDKVIEEKNKRIKELENELKKIAQKKQAKKPKFFYHSLQKQERINLKKKKLTGHKKKWKNF